MYSRRTPRNVVLVAALVVVPSGCQEPAVENPVARDPVEQKPLLRTGWKEGGGLTFARGVSIGGKDWDGPFETCDALWSDERRWLFLCIAGYSGKPMGPVALVISRVALGSKGETRNVSDAQNIFTIQTSLGSNHAGKEQVIWALRKDITESMQIGGKQYDLKKGRVFLVDAVGQSISAHQISADLGGTFVAPGPNFEKQGAELESLLEKDVKVKRFWMGDDPNAEDS